MIHSVDRALSVLCLFSQRAREIGITEMGQLLDLPKSTVHGLVKTLEARGFLVKNTDSLGWPTVSPWSSRPRPGRWPGTCRQSTESRPTWLYMPAGWRCSS